MLCRFCGFKNQGSGSVCEPGLEWNSLQSKLFKFGRSDQNQNWILRPDWPCIIIHQSGHKTRSNRFRIRLNESGPFLKLCVYWELFLDHSFHRYSLVLIKEWSPEYLTSQWVVVILFCRGGHMKYIVNLVHRGVFSNCCCHWNHLCIW